MKISLLSFRILKNFRSPLLHGRIPPTRKFTQNAKEKPTNEEHEFKTRIITILSSELNKFSAELKSKQDIFHSEIDAKSKNKLDSYSEAIGKTSAREESEFKTKIMTNSSSESNRFSEELKGVTESKREAFLSEIEAESKDKQNSYSAEISRISQRIFINESHWGHLVSAIVGIIGVILGSLITLYYQRRHSISEDIVSLWQERQEVTDDIAETILSLQTISIEDFIISSLEYGKNIIDNRKKSLKILSQFEKVKEKLSKVWLFPFDKSSFNRDCEVNIQKINIILKIQEMWLNSKIPSDNYSQEYKNLEEEIQIFKSEYREKIRFNYDLLAPKGPSNPKIVGQDAGIRKMKKNKYDEEHWESQRLHAKHKYKIGSYRDKICYNLIDLRAAKEKKEKNAGDTIKNLNDSIHKNIGDSQILTAEIKMVIKDLVAAYKKCPFNFIIYIDLGFMYQFVAILKSDTHSDKNQFQTLDVDTISSKQISEEIDLLEEAKKLFQLGYILNNFYPPVVNNLADINKELAIYTFKHSKDDENSRKNKGCSLLNKANFLIKKAIKNDALSTLHQDTEREIEQELQMYKCGK